jgi:TPR repeat protein
MNMTRILLFVSLCATAFSVPAEQLERSAPDCAPEVIAKAREGAEQGKASSLYLMARYYSTGTCLQGDGQKAIDLYQKAAKLDYPPAFYNLGMLAATGQNFQLAESLFARGMELGHRGAELQLGILYSLVPPPTGDDRKAFAWLSVTANRTEPISEEAKDRLDVVARRLTPEALAQVKTLCSKLKEDYGNVPAFHF